MNTQETQDIENETFLGISRFSLNFPLDISIDYVFVFVAVNEVNSNNLQISRNLIDFQGKILIFKEFPVPFKRHFKFKEFKDLYVPCY